jgi:hypothetical protein
MFITVTSTENQVHHVNLDHVIDVIEESTGLLIRLSASSFTEGQSRPSSFQVRDELSRTRMLSALNDSQN